MICWGPDKPGEGGDNLPRFPVSRISLNLANWDNAFVTWCHEWVSQGPWADLLVFVLKLCAFSELFFWGRSHELGNRDSQNIKIILLRITQRDVFEHWSHQLCPLVPHLGSDLEPRWNLEVISRLEGHLFSHTPWFAHRPCRLLWDSHVLVAEKPQGTKWEREDVVTWWWDTYAQCLQERSLECHSRQRGQDAG